MKKICLGFFLFIKKLYHRMVEKIKKKKCPTTTQCDAMRKGLSYLRKDFFFNKGCNVRKKLEVLSPRLCRNCILQFFLPFISI